MRLLYGNRIFSSLFGLMRGGFDVFAELAGVLDDGGHEVDPVLREVAAMAPLGVAIDAIGVL